jgi:hypothetical protein
MVVTNTTDPLNIIVANLEGVDALHQGVELDFVARPINHLELRGMLSVQDNTWQSNATGYMYDTQGQPVNAARQVVELMSADHAKVDVNLKGIHVGNSAQTTAAFSTDYEILKGFNVGFDANYFGQNYASFRINPAIGNNDFQQPWQIPDAVTVDFNARYNFRIGEYQASLVGNVNNLLDNEYITDAADGSDHTWKTAQVFYGFGRTFSTSLKIKF